MIDVVCSHQPMTVGESRLLEVSGDGPFSVKIGFFVTDPPPVGLQEQANLTVPNDGSFDVKAEMDFWSQHKGGIQVDLTDAKGAKRRVHFNVQPAPQGLAKAVTRV